MHDHSTMDSNMLAYVSRTLGYRWRGRLHSPKDKIGKVFVNPDGRQFRVFAETVLDPIPGSQRLPEAMFRVQFRLPRLIPWRDRLIISVKSPIFVALPGFRSKLWMVDEKNNTYQGVYEWDTLKDADDYVSSASMAFMTKAAIPGGISYDIIPGGRVVERGSRLSIAPGGAN